ncbi:WAT1-related protein isoform X1 [Tanacetum coccineum]
MKPKSMAPSLKTLQTTSLAVRQQLLLEHGFGMGIWPEFDCESCSISGSRDGKALDDIGTCGVANSVSWVCDLVSDENQESIHFVKYGLAIEWNSEDLTELLEGESDEFVLNHEGDKNDAGVISLKSDLTIKVQNKTRDNWLINFVETIETMGVECCWNKWHLSFSKVYLRDSPQLDITLAFQIIWTISYKSCEKTSRDCLMHFCNGVMELYGEEFLRKPTQTDVEKLYAFHEEKHGFPAIHFVRSGCPTRFMDLARLLWCLLEVPFVANDVTYKWGYYLTDGIYPEWAVLMKSISQPGSNDVKRIRYIAAPCIRPTSEVNDHVLRIDVLRFAWTPAWAFGLVDAQWENTVDNEQWKGCMKRRHAAFDIYYNILPFNDDYFIKTIRF